MVGGKTSPSEKWSFSSTWDDYSIPNWMESHKTVPNHQPAMNLWLWRNGDFQWLTINTWWIEKKKTLNMAFPTTWIFKARSKQLRRTLQGGEIWVQNVGDSSAKWTFAPLKSSIGMHTAYCFPQEHHFPKAFSVCHFLGSKASCEDPKASQDV